MRDLYDAQRGTETRLGEVAVQLATIAAELRAISARLDSGSKTMEDHEKRIRALEQRWWKLAGAIGVVDALAVLVEWLLYVHK